MQVAIAQEQWHEALEAAQQLTPFYRMVYPKVRPLLWCIVSLPHLESDSLCSLLTLQPKRTVKQLIA